MRLLPDSASSELPPLWAIRAELARRSLKHFVRQSWHVLEPSRALVWNFHLDAICLHVQALLEGRIPKRSLYIAVPPGAGKPCYIGGMVLEKKRGLIALGDVRKGDRVLTHRGRFRKVTAVHKQGTLPLWEIRTRRGRVVKVAADHPLLTGRGWIEAQHVRENDVLAEVHPQEPCGASTVSPEEARLLGYLIGDGCLSQCQAATFTNQDPETVADFIACAAALGFDARVKKRPGKHQTTNVVSLCQSSRRSYYGGGQVGEVRQWVRSHGLERTTSYTKHVPAAILAGDEITVANFLAAYWACDGYISDRRDVPRAGRVNQLVNAVRVGADTVSPQLGAGLLSLLTRLGLSFALQRRENKRLFTKRQGSTYVHWRLTSVGQDASAKFIQRLAPLMRHAKARNAADLVRSDFDTILTPDLVVRVEQVGEGVCRCLTVEEDESFSFEGVAVHNSRLVSVCAPAWMWTHTPSWRGIFSSANPRVVMRDSMYCRQILESPWYQQTFRPDWALATDQNAKGLYRNTKNGFRQAVSANAKVTGDRADGLFWDDLLDAADAPSKAERDRVNYWYDNAFANRLNDAITGIRCGIGQRLWEDDPGGHVLASGEYELLSIPQEFQAPTEKKPRRVTVLGWTDPRTEQGALYFPARFDATFVEAERRRLGSAGFAAQHNQEPEPAGGLLFKREWWKLYTRPTGWESMSIEALSAALGIRRIATGWDTALTESQEADYTSYHIIGQTANKFLVLDHVKGKWEYPTVEKMIITVAARWKPHGVPIEGKGSHSGKAAVQSVRSKSTVPAIEVPNIGLDVRAAQVSPTVEAGVVYLPDDAPWVEEFISSMAKYPKAAHDDDVASFCITLGWLLFGETSTGIIDYYAREVAEQEAAKKKATA